MKRLCCEPRRLCRWMELVYRQISLIYVRVLSCSLFWTLLTFLIGLLVCGRGSSNWGITKNLWWSDITAGFSHHTCRGSVFLISQVFDQRHHFPSHHYNNHDEAESMVCKLRQESPGEKLVSVSSGQQVLRLYHWSLKCEYPKKLFNHPTRLGVCRY